jgi:O-antigen/teichoic acid export membrane protein
MSVPETMGKVGLYQISSLALGFATAVTLSRWLAPAGRGDFILGTLIVQSLILLMDFGLPVSSTTFTLRRTYPVQTVFSNSLSLALFRVVAVGVAVALIWLTWPRFHALGVPALFLVWAVATSEVLMTLSRGLLFSVGLLRHWAVLDLACSAAFAVLMGLAWALRAPGSAVSALCGYCAVRAATLIWAARLVARVVRLRPAFEFDKVRALLKFGFRNLLNNLAWGLGPRIDSYVVGAFLLPADLGIYSLATGLADKMTAIMLTIPTGLFRFQATGERGTNRVEMLTARALRMALVFGVVLTTGVVLLAGTLVPMIFGKDYRPAAVPLTILSVSALVGIGFHVFRGYLVGSLMRPETSAVFGLALIVVGGGLNIVLVPRLGIVGAACASLVAGLVVFVPFLFLFARQTGIAVRQMLVPNRDDLVVFGRALRRLLGDVRIRLVRAVPVHPGIEN